MESGCHTTVPTGLGPAAARVKITLEQDGLDLSQGALEKLFAALERTGVDYSNLHRAMTAIFSSRGCGADSEGLADITLLDRLAKRVDRGEEVRDFISYSKKIAYLVYLEYLKDREKFRNAMRDLAYLRNYVQEFPEEPDLRRRCQKDCVGGLAESERELMINYYVMGKDRGQLAEELGWLIDTLRTRIYRLRERLKKCVADCRKRSTA